MSESRNRPKLDQLFDLAAELESTEAQSEFLNIHCQGQPELRRQLEKMLACARDAKSFLEVPPGPPSQVSHSVLRVLEDNLGNMPRILLQSPNDSPILRQTLPDLPTSPPSGRYQFHGEIARGGMGAVLKGRDSDLGRELAAKVLLEQHKHKPEFVRRFIEEAQIGGQLSHPGVAPVYELGQLEDSRPFFTMKLVKGQTLAAMLSEREDTHDDLEQFLGIFLQICQTVAYAHSRGVIHRDLKPANVMVGSFGEVQVMDWGLAKVLDAGGIKDEAKAKRKHDELSPIRTIRSEDTPNNDFGSDTRLGSVMGTLAYISPEQAVGDVETLDERADVFALGAILCELLTGSPPYVAESNDQLHRLAAEGRLGDCYERLLAAGVPKELRVLVHDCLQPKPSRRLRRASVVAEKLSTYQQSQLQRLKRAELEKVASDTQAREERRRRKLYRAAAVVSAGLFVLAGFVAFAFREISVENRTLAQKANEQATESRVNELASAALSLSKESPERGALLAVVACGLGQRSDEEPSYLAREALMTTTQQLAGRPILGHEGRIQQMFMNEDRLVALSQGKVFVWDIGTDDMIRDPRVFGESQDPITAIAMDESRRWLYFANSRLIQLDLQKPNLRARQIGSRLVTKTLGVTRDGTGVAATTIDGKLIRWRVQPDETTSETLLEEGKLWDQILLADEAAVLRHGKDDLQLLRWSQDELESVELSPSGGVVDFVNLSADGRYLAACEQERVSIYDLLADNPNAHPRVAKHSPFRASRAKFSKDGTQLYTWLELTMQLGEWNLSSHEELLPGNLRHIGEEGIMDVYVTNDRSQCWLAEGDGHITFLDLRASAPGTVVKAFRLHDRHIETMAVDPNERWLATSSWDGSSRLWDISGRDPRNSPIVLRSNYQVGNASCCVTSSNGRWIAKTSNENVNLWDMVNPREHAKKLSGPQETVDRVQFGHAGRRLLARSETSVFLWDFDGTSPTESAIELPGVADAIMTHQESKIVLFGDDDTVRIADWSHADPLTSAKLLGQLPYRNIRVDQRTSISPDDRWLAVVVQGSDANINVQIYIWDLSALEDPEFPKILDAERQVIWDRGMKFTRDSRWLVTGGGNSEEHYGDEDTVRIWDVHDLDAKPQIIKEKGDVWEVAMTSNRRWLYVSRHTATAELRDLESGKVYKFDEIGTAAAISPDERWLALGGRPHHNVLLFDLHTNAPLQNFITLRGHEAPAQLAFSDDGRWLVTNSPDGTVRRWSLDTKWLVEYAKSMAGRDLTPKEMTKYGL